MYTDTKTENLMKTVFLMEKYNEDARQDEKHVPDLLEAIMRPTDPVKEELRQKLFKIDRFGSKIKNMRVSIFLDSGIPFFFPPEANATFSPSSFSARNGLPYPNKSNIWPR